MSRSHSIKGGINSPPTTHEPLRHNNRMGSEPQQQHETKYHFDQQEPETIIASDGIIHQILPWIFLIIFCIFFILLLRIYIKKIWYGFKKWAMSGSSRQTRTNNHNHRTNRNEYCDPLYENMGYDPMEDNTGY